MPVRRISRSVPLLPAHLPAGQKWGRFKNPAQQMLPAAAAASPEAKWSSGSAQAPQDGLPEVPDIFIASLAFPGRG